MTAIIFGAGGQDGYYLDKLLVHHGIKTLSITRNYSIGLSPIVDVSDFSAVKSIISITKPEYIFNFAANSTTNHDALFENHSTISTGTLNILEAVRLYSPTTKVFITGSAVQFENNGNPIDENSKFAATSPYAIARIQSVYAARYYRSLGIKTYVGYLFHHESPIRPARHISRLIVDTAKRIANGSKEQLILGNTKVVKEWAFAEDIVQAIFDLVNQDAVFEAVIGIGKGYSIQDWVDVCFDIIGISGDKYIKIKSNFNPEYNSLISNPLVIKSLGWSPKIDFVNLAKIMMGPNETL